MSNNTHTAIALIEQECDPIAFNLLNFSARIHNHIKTGLDCLCDRPQALQ
ncbi:hypothetical protein [Nostoc flagelliforme]|nr:hypothetical protein [Nostoc flagelliforme]